MRGKRREREGKEREREMGKGREIMGERQWRRRGGER